MICTFGFSQLAERYNDTETDTDYSCCIVNSLETF